MDPGGFGIHVSTVVGHASGTGDRRAAGESAVSEGLRRLHLGVYFLHSGSGVDYADVMDLIVFLSPWVHNDVQ